VSGPFGHIRAGQQATTSNAWLGIDTVASVENDAHGVSNIVEQRVFGQVLIVLTTDGVDRAVAPATEWMSLSGSAMPFISPIETTPSQLRLRLVQQSSPLAAPTRSSANRDELSNRPAVEGFRTSARTTISRLPAALQRSVPRVCRDVRGVNKLDALGTYFHT